MSDPDSSLSAADPLPAVALPSLDPALLSQLGLEGSKVGIVIVDHGSRRPESNELLLQVVELFRTTTRLPIVEPAHMELAEPSIDQAFQRVVQQGAELVVVHPYFLAPGRHWRRDIPQLAAEAAERHPGIRYLVTAPLGLHPLIQQVMQHRILHCLRHAMGKVSACDVCESTPECQFRLSGQAP